MTSQRVLHDVTSFIYRRANKIVKEFFCKYYLTEQNILDKEEQEKIMLKLIPDESIFSVLI